MVFLGQVWCHPPCHCHHSCVRPPPPPTPTAMQLGMPLAALCLSIQPEFPSPPHCLPWLGPPPQRCQWQKVITRGLCAEATFTCFCTNYIATSLAWQFPFNYIGIKAALIRAADTLWTTLEGKLLRNKHRTVRVGIVVTLATMTQKWSNSGLISQRF